MLNYDPQTGEIFLYDEIGPGWLGMIDDVQFTQALKEIGPENRVLVRINSPGGFVDQGIGIVNALKRHPAGFDTVVDSLAASMASWVMISGESRTIAKNAKVMIHSVRGGVWGTSKELRKAADVMDLYGKDLTEELVSVMGIDADEVEYLLDEETWYLGPEAVEAGLATALVGESEVEPIKVAASRYKRTPKDLIDESKQIAAVAKKPEPINRLAAEAAQRQVSSRIAAILK